ncbi:MAG: DUF4148 domain-containing protein [Burkholderiaceae bacterium]
MTRTHASLIALTLAAFTAGHAFAADDAAVGKTREQVKAELAEAIRTGDIVGNDESGRKLNELFPQNYTARATAGTTRVQAGAAPVGKTREQVKAELADAIRTGNIQANDESGRKLNEVFPSRYEVQQATGTKTREQVKAELAEALRTGEILASGDSGKKLNELFPSSYPRTN